MTEAILSSEPSVDEKGPAEKSWIRQVATTLPEDVISCMVVHIEREILMNDGADGQSKDIKRRLSTTKRRLRKALELLSRGRAEV